jgi:hypothetical protein
MKEPHLFGVDLRSPNSGSTGHIHVQVERHATGAGPARVAFNVTAQVGGGVPTKGIAPNFLGANTVLVASDTLTPEAQYVGSLRESLPGWEISLTP